MNAPFKIKLCATVVHNLVQGEDEWHEFRLDHYGASEAAAMLGISKMTPRTELLRAKSTGIAKEFSAWVQEKILDKGHAVEALARVIVEGILGEDLYSETFSKGKLSVSTDGGTADLRKTWECKQWNEALAESVRNNILPEEHKPQCQQNLLVTEAKVLIFTVSDGTPEKTISMEVYPDQAWFERIIAGWEQFEIDLATYVHEVVIEKPKAQAAIELPTLFVHAQGEITENNMKAYGELLTAKLVEVRAIQLITDQDYANAKAAAKTFREQCKKLVLVKEAMLSQTVSIGEAARMMDLWHEDLRVTALQLEKDVEKAEEAEKMKLVSDAKAEFAGYVSTLEESIKPIKLIFTQPNFPEALKRQQTIASRKNKINEAMANAKIEVKAIATDIQVKLEWLHTVADATPERPYTYGFLFRDLQALIYEKDENFRLHVNTRIGEHQAAEEAKLATERAAMQAEADAKAKAEQEAIIAAERAKMEAESKAKIEAEVKAYAEQAAEVLRIETEKTAAAKVIDDAANAEANAAQRTIEQTTESGIPIPPDVENGRMVDKAADSQASQVDVLRNMHGTLTEAQQVEERRRVAQCDESALLLATVTQIKPVETVTIPKAEYERLLKSAEWLECLEAAGVDNWSGFDEARAILNGEAA